jgi:hypothetical protein
MILERSCFIKSFRLSLNETKVALSKGIRTGVDSTEREGIPLGISDRLSKSFTVRLASGDNAPIVNKDEITDCHPRLAAASDSSDMVLWLERTPDGAVDKNASMVWVDGFAGYTTLKGKPRVLASGPETAIMTIKNNSAVAFIARNGQQFVLFTDDNAREPKVVLASEYRLSRSSEADTRTPSGVEASRR